ncbi:hypothetical protein HPP92_014425 [Vanilla planifolia]|uniref:Uncharacterized protein n=1 Tax=Vanilla planifolia TaxID=51239 RepID=A0A835QLE0_VANPL|nr:hypothetical protein HPP92_014425 [Vanilla planifolia]
MYEVFERMAFYGISSNLVVYLTTKLRQGTVASSNNVTYWMGTGFLTSVLGAYVADAHLGRFWTFSIASIIYFLYRCLLKPPPTTYKTYPAQTTASQPRSFNSESSLLRYTYLPWAREAPNRTSQPSEPTSSMSLIRKKGPGKVSFFNWWTFSIYLGTLIANTFLVYVQDNVGWSLGYAIPTIGLGISILIFYAGSSFYRHKLPQGGPLTTMARVLVAAVRKSREEKSSFSNGQNVSKDLLFDSRSNFRFLNKAAVIEEGGSGAHGSYAP